MAPILRRTTSDTYARHSTMSSVVGTGTGAFSTAFGASSLLHAASGSTKQATSRTCSMRIGMFVEKFFMVLPWTGGWKWVLMRRSAATRPAAPCPRPQARTRRHPRPGAKTPAPRPEEHTSELQSIQPRTYDDFCLKQTNNQHT